MRALVIALMLVAPGIAHAYPKSLHDKAWYASHQAQRDVTLRFCHADAARADLPDCQNAEAADAGQIGLAYKTPDQYLRSPAYWAANNIARAGALVQCARRGPGDVLVLPYCSAIRQGSEIAQMTRAGRP